MSDFFTVCGGWTMRFEKGESELSEELFSQYFLHDFTINHPMYEEIFYYDCFIYTNTMEISSKYATNRIENTTNIRLLCSWKVNQILKALIANYIQKITKLNFLRLITYYYNIHHKNFLKGKRKSIKRIFINSLESTRTFLLSLDFSPFSLVHISIN